jgi:hypothetical protein
VRIRSLQSCRGSLILLVLCLLAVLGIALASYLAVANNAMKLSNRAYVKDVSMNLAEMGLERALRSFNASTFSGWTLSGSTATRTVNIASSNYGSSGISTAINIRVDRYNAGVWSAATSYAVNDMVWYRGVWFHCKAANANQVPPNTSYWVSAPAAWSADANYNATGSDIVISGGSAYRCTAANNNQAPPNASYWSSASVAAWSSSTTYSVDDVVLLGGTTYRCISGNTNQTPPNLTYWISGPVIYSQGTATLPDSSSTAIKTQLLATIAPAPLFPNAVAASNLVNLASGGTVDSYNSRLGTYASQVGSSTNNSAVLSGNNASGTAVTVTSARVNGYVAAPSASTTPFAPQWSYGGSAIVTSTAAPTIPTPKIDPTRVSRSPFIPSFDIQSVSGTITSLPAPALGPTTLNNGVINLGVAPVAGTASAPIIYNVTSTYSASAGGYFSGLLLYDSGNEIIINGPVILNVTGTYFGPYFGKITINSGGSLEIYFSSSTQMYFGNGAGSGIDNKTLDPTKLLIASNHANNTVNYHTFQRISTALPFYGTLYMPNAYVTVQSNASIYGAISATNVRFSSNLDLHYDTSLRTAGKIGTYIDSAYMITKWRELTSPSEQVTLP